MSNNSPKLPNILDAFHQEHWHLTKLLVLLSILALTSVGSFSLAQHLLPQGPVIMATPATAYSDGVCDADPNQLQSQYLPLPSDTSTSSPSSTTSTIPHITPTTSAMSSTSSVPKSSTRQTAFDGSAPSINTKEMAFVSSTPTQTPTKPTPSPPTPAPTSTPTPTSTVPAGWYTYGFTDDDAKYAEACAAQFVIDYHTFDYKNLASLQRPTSMLSAHAKKLFYLGGAEDTHTIHLHMLSTWKNGIQQHQQSQQATVQQPTLKYITPHYSNYFVEVDVGYKLIKEVNSEVQLPEIHHDTVILQNTSPSPKLLPNEQHGWEVEDWIDADA
jgi:hypothetical protein